MGIIYKCDVCGKFVKELDILKIKDIYKEKDLEYICRKCENKVVKLIDKMDNEFIKIKIDRVKRELLRLKQIAERGKKWIIW